jgi:diguanylate cyclase (GGDEF)-like protein/PAS domain S-box-containing protein
VKGLFSPKLQLSIGLLSLTISLIFVAASLGLLPNEERAQRHARATLSGALAIQLASLASRNDAAAIKDTIDSVVSQSPDILSIAVRDADGKLMTASRDHAVHWRDPPNGKSTPTHVQVPLLNGDAPAGRIEIALRPVADGGTFFGLPSMLLAFVGFIGMTGFVGYYLVLGRALRELDPGRAIPDRVKTAFDTLAEGVLIVDDEDRILMANGAFSEMILGGTEPELGSSASDLPWLSSGFSRLAPDQLPWRIAMHGEHPVLGIAVGIRDRAGQLQRLIVNATRIVDGAGVARGVIATFDNVTALHQTNEQLNRSIRQLHLSQLKISEQNLKLQSLASSDPLTGCLNRRTFFEQAEQLFAEAAVARRPLSFVMVDVDYFKNVNDRHGHLVGDKVLVGLADLLKTLCAFPNLVGRYGGEEFCIAFVGLGDANVELLVERLRLAVSEVTTWLPAAERTTVSIGIASRDNSTRALADLVKRADDALYAAKSAGRDCVVKWNGTSRKPPTPGFGKSFALAD